METNTTNGVLDFAFSQYIDECMYVSNLRPATIFGSKEAFKRFKNLVPEIMYCNEVTANHVTMFFKRLQTRERKAGKSVKVGIKHSTLRAYGSRLKRFFKWAIANGYFNSNPFQNIVLPNVYYTDERALKGEDIKKILGAIAQYSRNGFVMKRNMLMVGLMTSCGLRRNELISLEVRDINIHDGFITVRGETSKSKKSRKIPINSNLRLYIFEYLNERQKLQCTSEYLLLSLGSKTQLTFSGLKHWTVNLSRLSGVKFHVHRFRHTFATNLAMQDVSVVKIQNLMGHTDIKMTSSYLRSINTENLKEDINKLSFENIR